jgi:hypothetical protein
MAVDKIRMGVIGANIHRGWGPRSHLPAIVASPDFELTAVCTTQPERAEESAKAYGARLADQALTQREIDTKTKGLVDSGDRRRVKPSEPGGALRRWVACHPLCERQREPDKHIVGKENSQEIESKHINLRTRIERLVRWTVCLSNTERMHPLVIGLCINRYELKRAI